MMYYTIGQIFKKGLLISSGCRPYKDKASVSRALAGAEYELDETPYGMSKRYSEATIKKINARNRKLGGC